MAQLYDPLKPRRCITPLWRRGTERSAAQRAPRRSFLPRSCPALPRRQLQRPNKHCCLLISRARHVATPCDFASPGSDINRECYAHELAHTLGPSAFPLSRGFCLGEYCESTLAIPEQDLSASTPGSKRADKYFIAEKKVITLFVFPFLGNGDLHEEYFSRIHPL